MLLLGLLLGSTAVAAPKAPKKPAPAPPPTPTPITAPAGHDGPIPCVDAVFYVEASLPSGWVPGSPPTPQSARRCSAIRSDGQRDVGIYALSAEGDIDLAKLVEIAPTMFQDLGPVVRKENLASWWRAATWEVEYGPNAAGFSALGNFRSQGEIAWIVMGYSKDHEFGEARAVAADLRVSVPWSVRLGWVAKASAGAGLLLIAALFGLAGHTLREATTNLRALDEVRRRIHAEHGTTNQKWQTERRRHLRSGVLAGGAVLAAYVASFTFLPLGWAFASLLYLVALALGYHGLIVMPDTD